MKPSSLLVDGFILRFCSEHTQNLSPHLPNNVSGSPSKILLL
jgi:hypothetical protein